MDYASLAAVAAALKTYPSAYSCKACAIVSYTQ